MTNEGGSDPTSQDDGEDEEALNAEGYVVYEAITNPEVPSHIRLEQAKTMAQALAKGDPNTVRIVSSYSRASSKSFTSRWRRRTRDRSQCTPISTPTRYERR